MTPTFVMRKEPWKFIEKAILGVVNPQECERPRTLAITGIGGCGKTQLVLKFIRVHKKKGMISPLLSQYSLNSP